MGLLNIFKTKKHITRDIPGLGSMWREGYDDDSKTVWDGQITFLGINCTMYLTSNMRGDEERLIQELTIAQQNHEQIVEAIRQDAARQNLPEKAMNIDSDGVTVYADSEALISIIFHNERYDIAIDIANGEFCALTCTEQ